MHKAFIGNNIIFNSSYIWIINNLEFRQTPIKNMNSRNRQFGDVRSKNISKSSASLSINSNFHIASHQKTTGNNQPFTSSFIKKQKPLVCITCVNKKIAAEKKINESNNKTKQIQQFNTQLNYKNSQRDNAKEYRQQMLKQASIYNKKMISNHKDLAQSLKQLDIRYKSEIMQEDQKIAQQEKQMLERTKKIDLKYRKELYHQYKNQQEKKHQEKIEKLQAQINQLNLKQFDKSRMIKQYSTELKKQISSNNLKKRIEKERQLLQERQTLQRSQKEFNNYTQFMKDDNKTRKINPEVFEQLKILDYSKKNMKIQQQQMNNKERQEYLNQQKQLYRSQTLRSLSMKKDYEKDLKRQMNKKNLRLATEKEQYLKFSWRQQRYTQDLNKVIKPCEQCRLQYEEKCLI